MMFFNLNLSFWFYQILIRPIFNAAVTTVMERIIFIISQNLIFRLIIINLF